MHILTIGNTAQSPPDGFSRHLLHPKEVPLGYIFSVISHKFSLQYDSIAALNLCNLPKNLTAHLPHNLCAVLPILIITPNRYYVNEFYVKIMWVGSQISDQ